jgi:HAE1 family hydrophobic/amphiphilic exporter-1
MRIAALVLLGLICLTKLPVDLLPKVSLPTVAVVTQWPNVAPEELETQITRPLEEALAQTPNLYQVQSDTVEGISTIRVQFQWGTDIGQGAVDVLQLVSRAERNFPTGDPTLTMPTVSKFDPTQIPILQFGVSGETDPVRLRMILDNQVTPIIESANGVAGATTTGGLQRAILVDVDPVKLQAHNLSLDQVINRLNQENINLPAGIAKQGHTEYTIRSLGWFSSPQDIARIPVGTFNGQTVSMGEIADVKDKYTEQRVWTRLNGSPAAGIIITQASGANTISTTQAVYEKLKLVNKLYPQLKFKLAYDQSRFISDSVNDVAMSALIGGILAVLILMFFLRNIKSTLVVALSIPISIISTFALIYMCGFTINTMSLGGLALATGLIVDDAVVVLENIFRHIERDKKTAMEAAVSGTDEIVSAVLASTWTVMVVFLPLLLIKGQAGQMFTQFALVVIFSLAVSLLDATTIIPMFASRFIQGEAHHEDAVSPTEHQRGLMLWFHKFGEWFGALDKSYRTGLQWALHHRYLTIGGATALTIASFMLVPMIGTEMMPVTDSGDFNVTIKLPVGTAVATTNATMKQVEQIILSNPNVSTAFSAAGTSMGLRGTGTTLIPYQGAVTVKLKDERKQNTTQVITDLRRKLSRLPGIRPLLTQTDLVSTLMTGGAQNVEVDIMGSDLTTLSGIAKDVMARFRAISGLENVDVNWQEAMPEVQWKVDREKAAHLGVSFSDVANTIYTATNGTLLTTYYQEKGFQYPIQVEMPESVRKTPAQMKDLMVMSSQPGFAGNQVLLSQVATPIYGTGPSEITRQDRQRFIAITGMPQGRSAGEIQKDITKALEGLQLPSGYYWDWGTNQKRMAEEFSGMWLAVLLAIGLIYMLLASQFESYVHPLTILFSVPLAITGVLLGLFLTGRAFGLTAFIGVLMLVGIVVKNGILLVDYTNVLRGRGIHREQALLTAGPTRLRPILMTASAAMLGMLPIAIGLGRGSEIQAPMATAVIGGLATSTFLTLFVVPCVYSVLDDYIGGHYKDRDPE